MSVRTRIAVVLVPILAAAAACGDDGAADKDGALEVVAAFYPLAEATRRVGGDAVRVRDLTPAGVEPHDLELTSGQVDAIEDADLVVYVSGDFQPAVEEVAERQGGAALDLLPRDAHGDPHFWLDPVELRDAVDRIAGALADVRPGARGAFERRAAAFGEELTSLDREIAAALRSCTRRQIVTSHDSFGYLVRRYDLEQAAIAGGAPEAEPDADRISELAFFIDDAGITTVFTDPLAPPDIARTLAREADVEVAVLDSLEGRPEGDGDYLSVMRDNVAALAAALECEATP